MKTINVEEVLNKTVVKKTKRVKRKRTVIKEKVTLSFVDSLSRWLNRKELEWHDDDYESGFDGKGKDW